MLEFLPIMLHSFFLEPISDACFPTKMPVIIDLLQNMNDEYFQGINVKKNGIFAEKLL